MIKDFRELTISKDLSEFIIPLGKEEFSQLEQNIIAEGCREPLIAWKRDNGSLLLVDGHNRYKICKAHNLPFKVKTLSFSNIEEAKVWMVDNQIGRRNLTPDQLSYYRGAKYLSLKKVKGGYENVKAKGSKDGATSEQLADKFNVSESTIKRDAKFAEGLNIIARSNPKLKLKILSGEVKVKKADVQTLTDARKPDNLVIRNEADLHNKSKNIRTEMLDEVESNLRQINNDRLDKARKVLNDAEPAFLEKGDRLRKIKGMIISAINRAINERDVQAIKELKKLIDKLADAIFD